MDAPFTPTNPFAPVERSPRDAEALRHNAVRAVALVFGAGVAIAFASSAHTAVDVSLLMLGALLLLVGTVTYGHVTGSRRLRLAQFRPAAPMAGTLPSER
ncbi:hypothetical protein [Pseudonocardia dioxanivorans]|uniref:hypothetical protein n=1 Tax=Pseudonocardia dioxanivorans TaxID=240495 RepID=UPI000CD0747A|nr:hypothetical protein [Pseudonocardia dioxanivorans]